MSDIKESLPKMMMPHEIAEILRALNMEYLFDNSSLAMEQAIQPCPSDSSPPLNSLSELVQWLDDVKSENHFFVEREGLKTLKDWNIDHRGYFSHKQQKFFKIVGMRITSHQREVKTWSQPILDNEGIGIIGLLLKRIGRETYYLMQAKPEAGNRNIVQIAPTVQFNPGNYIDNQSIAKPFLFDEFMSPEQFETVHESRQSEEGGRFYQEEHIHRILLLPHDADLVLPLEYKWFSCSQIRFFLHLGETVNSCARSILACIL